QPAVPQCGQLGRGGPGDPRAVEAPVRPGCRQVVRRPRALAACYPARVLGARCLDRWTYRRRRCARLVPEHDLAFADAEDRRRSLARAVALLVRAVAQHEGGASRVAGRLDRDQPARAGQRGVPRLGLRLRVQADRGPGANDLGAGGEELRGARVVARVELLAPGPDDALRRGRRRAAARQQSREEDWDCEPEPQDPATNITPPMDFDLTPE